MSFTVLTDLVDDITVLAEILEYYHWQSDIDIILKINLDIVHSNARCNLQTRMTVVNDCGCNDSGSKGCPLCQVWYLAKEVKIQSCPASLV